MAPRLLCDQEESHKHSPHHGHTYGSQAKVPKEKPSSEIVNDLDEMVMRMTG